MHRGGAEVATSFRPLPREKLTQICVLGWNKKPKRNHPIEYGTNAAAYLPQFTRRDLGGSMFMARSFPCRCKEVEAVRVRPLYNEWENMVKQKLSWATIISFVMAIGVINVANAEDWKVQGEFGWFGVGTAHQIEEGHFFWVGEFSGTFFNDKGEGSLFHRAGVKCPAFNDVNYNTNKSKAGGYCVISDTDGDQAYLSWRNEGDQVDVGPGTFTYTGGTGKYVGIEAADIGTFVGVTQVNWADGTATGFATWNR